MSDVSENRRSRKWIVIGVVLVLPAVAVTAIMKRGGKKNEAERCQRICDLAEATCDLADKICELAQSHPDEVRYDEACSRAEHQCRVAAEACTACAD